MPLIIAMGSKTGVTSPEKIPLPDKKYKVILIDQEDVTTECRSASIDGNTFVEGKLGNGSHAISFDKINNILFHLNADKLTAVLRLNDGSHMELVIGKSSKVFGMTKHGTFQIKLMDLKKMTIEGPVK
jgi:hypothetical protein